MIEIWREIYDVEGYEISNLGMVRNSKTGRILKPYANRPGGYLKVQIGQKQYYIHKLVAETFIKRNLAGCRVTFIDGNRNNICVSNLSIQYPDNYTFNCYYDDF